MRKILGISYKIIIKKKLNFLILCKKYPTFAKQIKIYVNHGKAYPII